MTDKFKKKVVLVTGGGRGIGKAIAEAFGAEGARVMIAARTISHGESVVASLKAAGVEASVVQASNSDRSSMKAMVEKTVECYGGLDIVVHSAAHWVQNEVVDMDEADFDEMVASNINSLFWLAKDCEPYLSKAEDKGRLIYISSGSANRQYVPGLICYTATKAYLNFFARGLAMELGKRNILVNVVEPGLIASDRVKGNIDTTILSALTTTYPVPRAGLPTEIASSVLFLASNEASYITGTTLLVDGGGSMSPMPDLEGTLAEAGR
ncbi:MAG: SDR family NAD(P)-dependent oxidoreductase [Spongiibacteraceae bacterium]